MVERRSGRDARSGGSDQYGGESVTALAGKSAVLVGGSLGTDGITDGADELVLPWCVPNQLQLRFGRPLRLGEMCDLEAFHPVNVRVGAPARW